MAARRSKNKAAKSATPSKPGRKTTRKVAAKRNSSAKTKKAAASRRGKTMVAQTEPQLVAATPFQLPERFDSTSAASVLDDFRRHRGSTLAVDASAVRRVGAQGLQILLSATRTWQADGHSLHLENASAELVEAAHLLGLSNTELSFSGSLQ